VHDPIGGPIGVAVAERLGSRAVLVTPDLIAGNELSRSGDLAPANVRLQQTGVRIEKRAILRSVHVDHVEVDDRFTGARRRIDALAVIDCGYRLPVDDESSMGGLRHVRAGDCVAPRTIHEAILEGRRAHWRSTASDRSGPYDQHVRLRRRLLRPRGRRQLAGPYRSLAAIAAYKRIVDDRIGPGAV
jgi:hypothetical protein